MNTNRVALNWGLVIIWVIAALFGVVVGFIVFFIAMSIAGESLGSIPVVWSSLVMAGCFGTVIGLAQGAVLRRCGYRSAAWFGATLLGILIASPGILRLGGNFGPVIRNSLGLAATLGTALGIVQGLTLRKKAVQSVLWIGISIVSWVIAGWIGKILIPLSYEWGPILFWIGLFFSGTVLSSAGLMWLLKDAGLPAEITVNEERSALASAPSPAGTEVLEARKARVAAGLCPKCGVQLKPNDQNCPSCRINLAFARAHLDQW
jgi:FtsH-binding integral membrane protein